MMEVQLMYSNARLDQRDPLPMIAARLLKLTSFDVRQYCKANLNWPRFFQEAGHRITRLLFHPTQKSVLHHLRRHCVNLKTLALHRFDEEDASPDINDSFFRDFMPKFEELRISRFNYRL